MAKQTKQITLTDFAQITDAIDWTLQDIGSYGNSEQHFGISKTRNILSTKDLILISKENVDIVYEGQNIRLINTAGITTTWRRANFKLPYKFPNGSRIIYKQKDVRSPALLNPTMAFEFVKNDAIIAYLYDNATSLVVPNQDDYDYVRLRLQMHTTSLPPVGMTTDASVLFYNMQIEYGSAITEYQEFVPNYPTGKNLWLDGTVFEQGSLVYANGDGINDAGALNSRIRIIRYIPVESSKTYIINALMQDKQLYCTFYFYDSNKVFISSSNNAFTMPKSFNTPSNAKYIKFVFFHSTTSTTSTDAKIVPFDVYNIQLELGSTATAYTLPEYAIKSVENPKITSCGKNLFDYKKIGNSEYQIPWTYYETGGAKALKLQFKPNTKYTMSSDLPTDSRLMSFLNNITTYTSAAGHNVCQGKSVTLTSDSEGVLYIGYFPSRAYYNDIQNSVYYLQVEEGETYTPYEPYTGKSVTVEGEFRGIRTDKDVINRETGIIDRNTTEILVDTTNYKFYLNSYGNASNPTAWGFINKVGTPSVQCRCKPGSSILNSHGLGFSVGAESYNYRLRVNIPWSLVGIVEADTNEQKVAKIDAWFTANPTQVVYAPLEPTTEALPADTLTALRDLKPYAPETNVFITSDTGVFGETTIEYVTRLAEHGLKLDGEELTQGKLNGKYLWAGKFNGEEVWWNKYYPGDIEFEQNTVPNILQNNMNVSTETREWKCIPFATETPNGKWNIVSHTMPETPTINETTGEVTCIIPANTGSGGTHKLKLRYTVTSRHGTVSADTPELSIKRIVAPYIGTFAPPSVILIGSAIADILINYNGSPPVVNADCSGLQVTVAASSLTLKGTPVYDDNTWSLTNGLAVPQSITATNEAGSYSRSWTSQRRLYWRHMVNGKTYKTKQGGAFGLASAVKLPIANSTELLDIINNDLPTTNNQALARFTSTEQYGAVDDFLFTGDGNYPYGNTVYRLIIYTGRLVGGVSGNWGYYSTGSDIRIPSTVLTRQPGDTLSGSVTTIVGSAKFLVDGRITISKGRKTKVNNWLNDTLYITG